MALTRPDDIRERRSQAVKTAIVLAAVAFTVFIAFLLTGILGSR